MNIDSVSYAVASKVVKTFAMEATRVRGQKVAINDRFLQIHDAKAVPANGAVPKRSFNIYGTAPFDFDLRQTSALSFTNGMVVAVSTTQATLTLDTDTIDLFVTGQSEIDDTGWSTAGDYTTVDEVLQVWAQAAAYKGLRRLEVTAVGESWIQIHAQDTPTTASIVAAFPIGASSSVDLFFGDSNGFGFVPEKFIAGVRYGGCTIAMSLAADAYDPPGTDDYYIKASYK